MWQTLESKRGYVPFMTRVGFPKTWVVPPNHPFINGIFPHKPSICGVPPWLWNPPICWVCVKPSLVPPPLPVGPRRCKPSRQPRSRHWRCQHRCLESVQLLCLKRHSLATIFFTIFGWHHWPNGEVESFWKYVEIGDESPKRPIIFKRCSCGTWTTFKRFQKYMLLHRIRTPTLAPLKQEFWVVWDWTPESASWNSSLCTSVVRVCQGLPSDTTTTRQLSPSELPTFTGQISSTDWQVQQGMPRLISGWKS